MSLSWKRNDFALPVCVLCMVSVLAVEPVAEVEIGWRNIVASVKQDVPPPPTIHPSPSIRLFCHFSTSLYLFISRATAISCLRLCLCVYMFLVYYWFRLWSFVYTLDHPFVLFCFVFFTLIFFSHYSFASSFYFQNFDCCVCVCRLILKHLQIKFMY